MHAQTDGQVENVMPPVAQKMNGEVITRKQVVTVALAVQQLQQLLVEITTDKKMSQQRNTGNESVPIQVAQCRFPGLAISKAILCDYHFWQRSVAAPSELFGGQDIEIFIYSMSTV